MYVGVILGDTRINRQNQCIPHVCGGDPERAFGLKY